MSSPVHDSFGDHGFAEITSSLDAVAERVQRIEPVVRDFNRRMRDVFGPCPSTPTGEWISLDGADTPVFAGGIDDLFRLTGGLEHITRLADGAEVRRATARRRAAEVYSEPLSVPDESPTLHPPAPSQIWNDRQKGDK